MNLRPEKWRGGESLCSFWMCVHEIFQFCFSLFFFSLHISLGDLGSMRFLSNVFFIFFFYGGESFCAIAPIFFLKMCTCVAFHHNTSF